jgi:hypothetical protein
MPSLRWRESPARRIGFHARGEQAAKKVAKKVE